MNIFTWKPQIIQTLFSLWN